MYVAILIAQGLGVVAAIWAMFVSRWCYHETKRIVQGEARRPVPLYVRVMDRLIDK